MNGVPSQRYLMVVEFINEKSYNHGWCHVITREQDLRIRFFLKEKGQANYNQQTNAQQLSNNIDQLAAHDPKWYEMKYEELLIQTDQRDDWIPEETYLQEEKKAGVFDNLFGKNKSK